MYLAKFFKNMYKPFEFLVVIKYGDLDLFYDDFQIAKVDLSSGSS